MCTASHSLFKRKPSESWAFLRAKTRLLCAQDAVADGEAVQSICVSTPSSRRPDLR